jgi:hypothetical protein
MPTTKTPPAKASEKPGVKSTKTDKSALDRTAKFSEQVLEQVETGQRSAIDAVRRFAGSVDKALPLAGDDPSKPHEVVDSALEMSDRLVQTQYDFLRGVMKATR